MSSEPRSLPSLFGWRPERLEVRCIRHSECCDQSSAPCEEGAGERHGWMDVHTSNACFFQLYANIWYKVSRLLLLSCYSALCPSKVECCHLCFHVSGKCALRLQKMGASCGWQLLTDPQLHCFNQPKHWWFLFVHAGRFQHSRLSLWVQRDQLFCSRSWRGMSTSDRFPSVLCIVYCVYSHSAVWNKVCYHQTLCRVVTVSSGPSFSESVRVLQMRSSFGFLALLTFPWEVSSTEKAEENGSVHPLWSSALSPSCFSG